MANEDIDKEVEEDLEDLPEEPEEGEEDTTDWKAEAKKRDGIARRLKTKLGKLKAAKSEEKPEEKKPEAKPEVKETLDRLDRQILRLEKITDPDEIKLVEDIKKETGKDVDTILGMKYFQAELKNLREEKEAKDAIPKGGKRSNQSQKDEVDYWLAKGGLPKDDPKLAQKVVNARMAKEKSKSQFSDNPVV